MTMPRMRRLAVGAAATLFLAGCAGGTTGSTDGGGGKPTAAISQADIDKAMKTPTELTFWTWLPDIEKEVALFQKKYPAISVKVVNAGNSQAEYTKLRTALKAGSGAPDVVQIEYQHIPGFAITGGLLDLRPYGAQALGDRFVDWAWGQVSGRNGEVWAIPQDTGPMGMLYRKDIFDKHGIQPPKTWDEFAAAARKLHAADPGVYLTNFPTNHNSIWTGLMWQAGVKPFQMKGADQISVDVAGATPKKLASYWSGLVKEGVLSADADFSDQWFQGLNKGRYATWLTAAWGPLFLSTSAKETRGKWRVAPLPQWTAGEQKSGNWGGSTSAVVKTTKNPIAAAMFAQFLNTDPESAKMLTTLQFLYPPIKALLSDPGFVEQKSDFYGGQQVNKVFADISGTVPTDFTWLPFMDQINNDWNETVGKSLADKTDTAAALDKWQQTITAYAEKQGFKVAP
ncbi:extracellular solute-binding protein [Nonomuraea sp. NPDC004186]